MFLFHRGHVIIFFTFRRVESSLLNVAVSDLTRRHHRGLSCLISYFLHSSDDAARNEHLCLSHTNALAAGQVDPEFTEPVDSQLCDTGDPGSVKPDDEKTPWAC